MKMKKFDMHIHNSSKLPDPAKFIAEAIFFTGFLGVATPMSEALGERNTP